MKKLLGIIVFVATLTLTSIATPAPKQAELTPSNGQIASILDWEYYASILDWEYYASILDWEYYASILDWEYYASILDWEYYA